MARCPGGPTASSAAKQKRGTSTAAPPHRRSSSRRRLLDRSRQSRTPPPRARRRRRSETSTRRGRVREDLFHDAAVASASTTPPENQSLDLLGHNLLAGENPAVSATSRLPAGHRRRRRPPAPPAGTRGLLFAAVAAERLRERERLDRVWKCLIRIRRQRLQQCFLQGQILVMKSRTWGCYLLVQQVDKQLDGIL